MGCRTSIKMIRRLACIALWDCTFCFQDRGQDESWWFRLRGDTSAFFLYDPELVEEAFGAQAEE